MRVHGPHGGESHVQTLGVEGATQRSPSIGVFLLCAFGYLHPMLWRIGEEFLERKEIVFSEGRQSPLAFMNGPEDQALYGPLICFLGMG